MKFGNTLTVYHQRVVGSCCLYNRNDSHKYNSRIIYIGIATGKEGTINELPNYSCLQLYPIEGNCVNIRSCLQGKSWKKGTSFDLLSWDITPENLTVNLILLASSCIRFIVNALGIL